MNFLQIAARIATTPVDPYTVKLGDSVDLRRLSEEQFYDFRNKLERRELFLKNTGPEFTGEFMVVDSPTSIDRSY